MERVDVIEGRVAVLDRTDVDTDQIIPKQFLKRVERTGFGEFLFYDWFGSGEIELEAHPILVTGRNFGSGSSREHAVWALADYGYEAIIAPSYSDIFYSNCTKNGLVPVVLPEATVHQIWDAIDADPKTEIVVDVERRIVEVPAAGITAEFPMDAPTQHRFLEGLDDVGITLTHADEIDTYEQSRPAWMG